jgi:hypothetical protein
VRSRNDKSEQGASTAARVRSAPLRVPGFGQRILGALDLAIDFATLGEYGLEPLPAAAPGHGSSLADGPCRERPGQQTGREAFAKARRGDCAVAGVAQAARA